jgi:hypothetical protein
MAGLFRFAPLHLVRAVIISALMTRMIRTYTAIVLSVMLALTGQSMAQARTMPGPAGEIVLCTGQGPVSIQVDAEGNPTGPAHICPDCVAAMMLGLVPAPTLIGRDADVSRPHWMAAALNLAGQPLVAAQARGPPRAA